MSISNIDAAEMIQRLRDTAYIRPLSLEAAIQIVSDQCEYPIDQADMLPDATIKTPERPSGTVDVTLEYDGGGCPKDTFDD